MIFATEQRIIMPYRFPDFNNGATTMPTIQCPHCSHEARVPSLEHIVGKNVKCPSCSQTFHVQTESPAPAVNADNDFNFQGQAPPISTPAPRSPSASKRSRRKESLFSPLTYDPNGATSARRYPNLMRYLRITETLITIWFKTTMVLIGLFFILGELGCVFFVIREAGLWQALGAMLLCPVLAFLAAMNVWLLYILYMAFIEFMRVTVDIENNTRG